MILGRYEPDIHWIHKRAGWTLQQRNAEPGRTDDRLSHSEFEAIADQRLARVGHNDDPERRSLVLQIRQAATDRLVLLVGNTENEIGFEIRSLQEFMAAEHSFDGGESCVQKTLHAIAPYGYWRNVFMFIAGRIFFERQELIDTLISVLWKMNEDGDVSFKAILAGSRLAVGLLKDGAARNQPGATRVIARCAAYGLDLRDFELTRTFSDVFAGHAEEVLKPELIRRLNNSANLFPEHNWFVCFRLSEAGRPWAQEAMSTFPFSREGARRMVDHFGELLPIFFWRALAPHVFSHPLSTFRTIWMRQPEERRVRTVMPKALNDFMDVIWRRSPTSRMTLLLNDRKVEVELLYSGQERLEVWRRLDYRKIDLSNAHPSWRACHAVSEFARNPSLSSLQSYLHSLAAADSDTDADHPGIPLLPWQIAAAIGAHRSGIVWPEVIRQIGAGSLGNEADWQRWETQIRNGVPLQDLRVTDKLTVADDRKGLIFSVNSWRYPQATDPVKLARELVAAIREWPQIGPKESLIDLCCFVLRDVDHRRSLVLSSRPRPWRQDTRIAVRDLIELCNDLEVDLPTSILPPLILSEGPVAEKRRLLINVGRQRLRQTWFWYQEIAAELDDRLGSDLHELLACDDQIYILRALSFLPPLGAMRQLNGLPLERLEDAGGELSEAAHVLRSSALEWTVQGAPEVVRRLLSLKESYPLHMNQLISFVEKGAETSPQLEAFFFQLVTQATAARDNELLETATSMLAKLVDRRSPLSSLPQTERNFHAER